MPDEKYLDEAECFRILLKNMGNRKLRCGRCGSPEYWSKPERRIVICKNCRKERSPLSGTMFSRSHLTLRQWFDIIRIMTNSPDIVVTAVAVRRMAEIGSYRTAWEAMRKIRWVIGRCESVGKLHGDVEFDELVIDGDASEYRKLSILGALETGGQKRLSLVMVKNPDEMNIKGYFKKIFGAGVNAIIDNEKLYIRNWLELNRIKQTSGRDYYGNSFMNIHIIMQDVKYGLKNGHFGVSEQEIQSHLNEFSFIFNHNTERGRAFELLLSYMTKTGPSEYLRSKRGQGGVFRLFGIK